MEISKLLTAVCIFLLLICTVFCTTALVSLRNAIAEHDTLQQKASDLISDMDACLLRLEGSNRFSEQEAGDASVNASLPQSSFCLRESNGFLCIYTADGELIECLNIPTATLPQSERERLATGISCADWQELIRRLQDYTT